MKLIVQPKIFEKFPTLHVGVVVLYSVDNSSHRFDESTNPGAILKKLREQEAGSQETHGASVLGELPAIQCWRKAYKSFGAKDYRSSVEALLKRAIKGDALPDINPLVNLYNYLSLKYLMPFGGENRDALRGDLVLGVATGDEPCVLLGEVENRPPKPGEIVYKDDAGVVCRRWNWREADRTKLEKSTKRAIIVCEDLYSSGDSHLKSALQEFMALAENFLKVRGEIHILHKEHQTVIVNSD